MLSFHIDRYPDNLTIFDTLQSTYSLSVGSAAEFSCLAITNDVNSLDYYYRRTDDNPLGDNVDRPEHDGITIDHRTTMFITEVTEANSGEYECLIRNITEGGDAITLAKVNFSISVSGNLVMLHEFVTKNVIIIHYTHS